jgi:hypothetical protein
MYVWELYSLVGFRLDGWHFDCRGAIYRVVYCALSFLFFSRGYLYIWFRSIPAPGPRLEVSQFLVGFKYPFGLVV